MYLSDRCWFLLCTCGPPPHECSWNFNVTREGEGQVQLKFQQYLYSIDSPPLSHPPHPCPCLVHKITNAPVFCMGFYLVVLRGQIHNSGHFRGGGGGPKNLDFFGPKWPLLWIYTSQNHSVPDHINNRYINSSSQIRQIDLHRIQTLLLPRAKDFRHTVVHFLSSICSESVHCWSSCRGLTVLRLRQGYV